MYRIIAGTLMAFVSAQTQANSAAFINVPTLDDMGLVVLSVIVAIAGGFAARRRKK